MIENGEMMSLGLVFPGRRARGHAVIREKLGRHPAVIRTLADAADILCVDAAALLPNGTLHTVIGDSAALVVGGVAVARALIANGLRPAAAGGIGLGAVSAAVISGLLSFLRASGLTAVGYWVMKVGCTSLCSTCCSNSAPTSSP